MSRKKSTLPSAVQDQLNRIVTPPCVLVTLLERDIALILRYREAKETMRQALNTACENAGSDLIWTDADDQAVEAAAKALQMSQIEMCALLDVAVLKAGVR